MGSAHYVLLVPTRQAVAIYQLYTNEYTWVQSPLQHYCLASGVARAHRPRVKGKQIWPSPTPPGNPTSATAACGDGSTKSRTWANCSASTAQAGTRRWAASPRC